MEQAKLWETDSDGEVTFNLSATEEGDDWMAAGRLREKEGPESEKVKQKGKRMMFYTRDEIIKMENDRKEAEK